MKLTINLKPVTKKNSQQILVNRATGQRFIAPSRDYKQYEKDACWELSRYGQPRIDCPVNVKCTYYMPTARRVDLVNLLEATCDVLVKAGILADDNSKIVASHDGSRVLIDRKNPRTEVVIERVRQ